MKISLAPMLDVTTPYFRKLINIISPSTILFTEMISPNLIIHNPNYIEKLKFYNSKTIIQFGSGNATEIIKAIKILQKQLFSNLKINLNCGCPSNRVQHGNFGAILMKNVNLVCEIINEIEKETGIIVSLKIRTGVDEFDSYDFFKNFVKTINENTNCNIFYVHARKCWLKGLSPHKNRNVPPLMYEFVEKLKSEFKSLEIHLNGGLDEYNFLNTSCDGFMFGRRAIEFPFVFKVIDMYFSDKKENPFENQNLLTEIENLNIKVSHNKPKININKYISEINNTYKLNIIEEYFKYLPPILKYEHIFPISNFLKGCRNGKIFRKSLNELIKNKIGKEIIFERIKLFFN